MSDLVGNPEDRFSREAAQMVSNYPVHRILLMNLNESEISPIAKLFGDQIMLQINSWLPLKRSSGLGGQRVF